MRTKLVCCQICKHWRLKLDHDHCPVCNAARLHVGNRIYHINVSNGKEIVSGKPPIYVVPNNLLQVAQALS